METWREVVNQVRESIVTTVDQSNREAHLQLDPPELGKLAIQLVMEGERIHAHIVAESADVGALIQAHLPELKQALHSHRLDLDTVRVEVQTGGGGPNTSSQNSQQEERASRHGSNLSMAQADTRDPETALTTPPVDHRGGVNVWA
jgi:flagellar hook-length control protein FliK